jgi:hypothetical protein
MAILFKLDVAIAVISFFLAIQSGGLEVSLHSALRLSSSLCQSLSPSSVFLTVSVSPLSPSSVFLTVSVTQSFVCLPHCVSHSARRLSSSLCQSLSPSSIFLTVSVSSLSPSSVFHCFAVLSRCAAGRSNT